MSNSPEVKTVHCVLPGCQWTGEAPIPNVPDPAQDWAAKALGTSLNALVSAKDRAAAAAFERDVARHLKTHSTIEWVTAVTMLRDRLTKAEAAP